jgi:hypothetical protein
MKYYFRSDVYFEIDLEEENDRQPAQKVFHEILEPVFEEFISKIKLTKEVKQSIKELSGKKLNVALLSKKQFVKVTGQKTKE